MNAVATVPIGDLVTIYGGGTPTRSNPDYYGGNIPWVTPKDMKSWEISDSQITITQQGLEESATRLIPTSSVLLVIRSGVLKHSLPVAISRRPVAINQDMKALVSDGKLLPDYLARFLQSSAPIVLQWVRATTADNFPIDKLRALKIPLPPLNEQRRIVAILDAGDALRVKRRAAVTKLDTLAQSIFIKMFGDPAMNPKCFPVMGLGSMIAEGPQNGLYKPSSAYGQGVPILRIDAFYDGRITDLGALKRLVVSEDEREIYGLHEGDIVINRVNSREYLGKSTIIPALPEAVVFESNMMR
jgi:type I restriction enzyme S subunit